MKTIDAIENRLSVREFSNKPVKFDLILEAIDAANHAPFAGNINNLKFILIEQPDNIRFITEHAQQFWMNDAQWIVIVCSEVKKLEELYQDYAYSYSKQQVGAAIENMLLRLTDMGLAACWVGAFAEAALKTKFKIPQEWAIEALIPIGYSKNKKQAHARKIDLENKIFWEVWNEKKKPRKYPNKDPSTFYTVGRELHTSDPLAKN